MKRIPVKSRDIASVGYDEHTQTLEVEFNEIVFTNIANTESCIHGACNRKQQRNIFQEVHSVQCLYGCIRTYPRYKRLR